MHPKPIRVLIAEDHGLVRAGFRALLEGLSGVEVTAETGNGQEALQLTVRHQLDVALLDISMPGLNGLEVARRALQCCPALKVIFLSMHQNEDYVLKALQSGAVGYLLKDSQDDELEAAIRAVSRGEYYLSPTISKQVIQQYLHGKGRHSPNPELLTARQREILQLLAEGNSAKEIAAGLQVSVKTVETHRSQIMERLAIHDLAGLVRYAIRTGLVSSES